MDDSPVTVIDILPPTETLPGSVVVAVGSRSVDNAALLAAAEAVGVPAHVIGDAKSPRRALDATREGFLVAKDL